MKDSLDGYDYELPLMDAMADPELPIRRRLLAGATVGIGLDIAHFAVSEMAEAFWQLKDETERGKNCSEGYLMLEAMLDEKNAFQMRLWHLLDETPLDDAAYDLAWLKALTYQRGQMANSVRKAGLPVVYASAAACSPTRPQLRSWRRRRSLAERYDSLRDQRYDSALVPRSALSDAEGS